MYQKLISSLIIVVSLLFCSSAFAKGDIAEITLQLKWKHQYQFAGYYAAQQMGYYRDAGLKVTIKEAGTSIDPLTSVMTGDADFAVGSSDVLLLKEQGFEPVILANIFQHSAVGFLSLGSSNVQNIHDLATRKIMIEKGSTELYAYLYAEGVDLSKLNLIEHEFSTEKLLNGEIEAITIYTTNEPYLFQKDNIPYTVFSPIMGGLDFYGDNLFTSQSKIDENPELVNAFLEASLKGWQYAMSNKEETVDLMLQEYDVPKSREHLLYEANETETLIMPEVVPIGFTSHERWDRTQAYYASLGILSKEMDLSGFIYDQNPLGRELGQLKEQTKYLTGGALLASITSILLAIFIIRFRSEIKRRRKAEQAISQALNEAEVANQAKSAFIATVSHEIRTPLSAILGTSQLLEATKTNKTQKELVDRLSRSGQFLLKLLNDILDFSKNENEEVKLNKTAFDPTELLNDIYDMMKDKAVQKEIALVKNIDALPPVLMSDPFLIRQIITNLLDNAIKFTITGTVTLEAFYLDKNADNETAPLCISVKDTGIGISPENQQNIFNAFKQEETGTSRKYGGNGLGLTICNQLVEALDGEIVLESAKGKGSDFSVILTLEEGSPQAMENTNLPSENIKPLKILLVDDFESNRITIAKLLSLDNHEVDTASSGEETISKVINNEFDIVLMDIHMPEMDGIETTKRIKEIFADNKNIPLIFAFTADLSAHAKEVYRSVGMLDTIPKPFDKKEFNQLISHHFDRHIITETIAPARSATATSKLLNLDILSEYNELLPENEFNKMLTSYEDNCTNTLSLMEQAITNNDAKQFQEYIHRLTGASGVIGFIEMTNWCQTLSKKEKKMNITKLLPEIKIGKKTLKESLDEFHRITKSNLL